MNSYLTVVKTEKPKNEGISYWTDCGIPSAIANLIVEFTNKNSPKYNSLVEHSLLARAKRFRKYWEENSNEMDNINKYWNALKSNAKTEDDLQAIFLVWPDVPKRQPYERVFGARKSKKGDLTLKDERKIYADAGKNVRRVLDFLAPVSGNVKNLSRDAFATSNAAYDELVDFMKLYPSILKGLQSLESLLVDVDGKLDRELDSLCQANNHDRNHISKRVSRKVNPAKKYLTRQPDDTDAPIHTYTLELANLNHYLNKPQNAALAYLAAANNPICIVKADAIRRAFIRKADTT